MTTKLTDKQKRAEFLDRFVDYYREKAFDGNKVYKDDKDFVCRIGCDWFDQIGHLLGYSQYKAFFIYLKFSVRRLIDPADAISSVRAFLRANESDLDPLMVDEEFVRFAHDFGSHAGTMFELTGEDEFRTISSLCSEATSLGRTMKGFAGKDLPKCKLLLWIWLKQNDVTENHVARVIQLRHQESEIYARYKATGHVQEFGTKPGQVFPEALPAIKQLHENIRQAATEGVNGQ